MPSSIVAPSVASTDETIDCVVVASRVKMVEEATSDWSSERAASSASRRLAVEEAKALSVSIDDVASPMPSSSPFSLKAVEDEVAR
jgi:hypothetical protein